MNQIRMTLSVPLDSLRESISALSAREELQILEALHEEHERVEEERNETNPVIQAPKEEARAPYQVKDYVTLDNYAARYGKK